MTSKNLPPSQEDTSDEVDHSGDAVEQGGNGHDTSAPENATRQPVIVGLGASAGGLDALQKFLENTTPQGDMAFVVVTHQHLGHTSMLPSLLSRHTEMPVLEIESGMVVEANHIYVTPPGQYVALLHGVLQLMDNTQQVPVRMPIDYFFRSLAQDQGDNAVAIVLSGTGSDGSLGLRAIKGNNGMCMAQSEESAAYDGMPRSAVATGQVDFVLPVERLPSQLFAFVTDAQTRGGIAKAGGSQFVTGDLRRIFVLLRQRTGHDFSNYKSTTTRRRIQRRMNLHSLTSLPDYVRYLQSNAQEIDVLFQELLINVTAFFRDPEAFEALAHTILTQVLVDKPEDYVVRVWVPGCSTGEEAYSIAILLRESMEKLNRHYGVQIFATDLDAGAIESARSGQFPEGIAQDISAERLKRNFTRGQHNYKINKDIREMVIFAPQNLVQDPPFTKLDLICCRNLLIYLDQKLQTRLFPIFHYSLRPGGVLFLGTSESVGTDAALFSPIDKKWKIFRRNEVPANSYSTGFSSTMGKFSHEQPPNAPDPLERPVSRLSAVQLTDRLLLSELVPPTILCDRRGEIVHIHGRTGAFLELAPGPQMKNNLFEMARDGLKLDLVAAIRQAIGDSAHVVHRGVRFTFNEAEMFVDLKVSHIQSPESFRGLFLVSFDHLRQAPTSAEQAAVDLPADRAAELLRELQHTKDVHQGTVEQLQTSNEELKSTNEELQSTNEELQSTNEEMETSKEEMQSLNEELHTVNAELQGKLAELARVSDDMKNLLNGTDIATIFLDDELRIKRFTEQVKNIANLIPSDIGRPLRDLVSNLDYPDLAEDLREVLRTLIFKEVEVKSTGDHWYQVRIMPYRTTDNVIDGLVITFVDISKIKKLLDNERKMAQILSSSPTCVFTNDLSLTYLWAGDPGPLGLAAVDIVGKKDDDFLSPKSALALAKVKSKAIKTKAAVRELVELSRDGIGPSVYDVYVQPVLAKGGAMTAIACVLSSVMETADALG